MLAVEQLSVSYGRSLAVDSVNFRIDPGQGGLGLVGESGSGKTTIARALLRLLPLSGGRVLFDGRDISRLRRAELQRFRRNVQVVFQDPNGTLDPRMRVGGAINEVLKAHGLVDRRRMSERVGELLAAVDLSPAHASRLPHELSGGQRQRVSIARALAVEPQILILDEPTSALDVTTQTQILSLIDTLRRDYQLSYLLISHNLGIVNRLCDEVVVLYLGRVVESGPTAKVLVDPAHPYTAALLSAVPDVADRRRRVSLKKPSEPQTFERLRQGCAFHPRCPIAVDYCRDHVPPLTASKLGGSVACHRASELAASRDLQERLWRADSSSETSKFAEPARLERASDTAAPARDEDSASTRPPRKAKWRSDPRL